MCVPVAQAADSWQEALEVLDILEERQEGDGKNKKQGTPCYKSMVF